MTRDNVERLREQWLADVGTPREQSSAEAYLEALAELEASAP